LSLEGEEDSYSMKTNVAKHESVSNCVTQKHLKSASHRTHTVVYTVCSQEPRFKPQSGCVRLPKNYFKQFLRTCWRGSR